MCIRFRSGCCVSVSRGQARITEEEFHQLRERERERDTVSRWVSNMWVYKIYGHRRGRAQTHHGMRRMIRNEGEVCICPRLLAFLSQTQRITRNSRSSLWTQSESTQYTVSKDSYQQQQFRNILCPLGKSAFLFTCPDECVLQGWVWETQAIIKINK